ncbi:MULTISPECIES: YhhA family cyclophane-containing RiPP [unclassified Aeromonas]|uniref:YhhA family cyclophane-containing RiPP n=2 Tax=Aeromonadaceae TaxID=84642 RepID=UPI0035298F7E
MIVTLQHVKEYVMSSAAIKIEESTPSTIRHSLTKGQSTNPAIQRLRLRVLTESDASQVITSYDRMHHRHNRS